MANLTIYRTEKPNTLGGQWDASYEKFEIPAAGIEMEAEGTYQIPGDFKDEHTVFVVLGTGADATVTVKAGNGYASGEDLVLPVANGKYQFFTLDSARYTDVETGEITITCAGCTILALAPRV